MAEVGQGVESLVHLENNISALSAVSAVGTSGRHIQLPAEADMTVSAFA